VVLVRRLRAVRRRGGGGGAGAYAEHYFCGYVHSRNKGNSRIWVWKGKRKGKFLFARHEGVRRSGGIPPVFLNLETMLRWVYGFPSVWRVPVPIEFGGRYLIKGIICILQLAHKVQCKVCEFLYVTANVFCDCQWIKNNGKQLQLLANNILFWVCHTFRP